MKEVSGVGHGTLGEVGNRGFVGDRDKLFLRELCSDKTPVGYCVLFSW